MRALIRLMSSQHGVASAAQARDLGVTWRIEQRLRAEGVVWSPCPGVLVIGGAPITFHRRAMAAVLTRGVTAISHGAAARLHGLDGFDRHDTVDVLGVKGANPHARLGVTVHRTRAAVDGHVVEVVGIPTLSIPATLAMLAPTVGIGRSARALDSALRRGVRTDEVRAVAESWRARGRSGPAALLMLLGERVDEMPTPESGRRSSRSTNWAQIDSNSATNRAQIATRPRR